MRKNHVNIPNGVLDTDSDLNSVSPNDFVQALNTRLGLSGVRENVGGTEALPYAPPVGTNTGVGCVEDKFKNTLIDFVKNSNGYHEIRRYWSDEDRYEVLMRWSGFNFNNLIHSAKVVDGKYLYWTDAKGEGTISGNAPRFLDMEMASLYQKKLCYELYYDFQSFAAGREYSIEIVDIDGTVILPSEIFRTSAGGDPDDEFLILYTSLVAGAYDIDVTFCHNKLIVCAGTAEQRIYITSNASDIHFVGINHYPETIIEPFISLIRQMPKQPPAPMYVQDNTVTENKVFGFTFQFRYRYHYWNGAKSKWSPISYVPTNFIKDGAGLSPVDNSNLYNKIVLEFDDDLISGVIGASWKTFIRKIEIAVRYEQAGVWKSVDVLDIADFGIFPTNHLIDFLNGGIYSVVPSDESSEGDVQALGNFDFVPRMTRTMETIQDEEGNFILALYGNLEQFDLPECVDAEITDTLDTIDSAPITFPSDQTITQKKLKAGGAYDFFIVYEDDYGRQSAAMKLGRFSVPFDTVWHVPTIALNHLPPIWATRFRIAISANQNQTAYIQLPTFKVTYWTKDPDGGEDGTFTSTTYGAGDAAYVGFEFAVPNFNRDDLVNFIFSDMQENFLVQPDDRLHVDSEDYRVEGYNLTNPSGAGSVDSYTVFIKFDSSQPDYTVNAGIGEHHVVELYRHGLANSNIIKEIGTAQDIDDAGLSSRNHGADIEVRLGDAYVFDYYFDNPGVFAGGSDGVLIQNVERPNLHSFKPEVGQDFGRAVVSDPDYKQVDSYDQIRVSDIYIPGSLVNGLHSFRGLEYIRTRRDYGIGQKLEYVGGVLLAIAQFASQPIYVGRNQLLTLDGDTSVGRSDRLLNIASPLKNTLGTNAPGSVVNTGEYVYAFDDYRGVMWYYSVGGGQENINLKNDIFFRDLGKDIYPDRLTSRVISGYQEKYKMWFVSIQTGSVSKTIAFKEGKGWMGDYSFLPECFGKVGTRFFSMKSGATWEHELGDECQFYGVNYDAEVSLVINSDPQAIKIFWNLREQGDLWHVPILTIPPGITPGGMESRIKPGKFTKFEGQWKVDLPRDATDPAFLSVPALQRYATSLLQGRHLRGEVMTIKFRLNEPQEHGVLDRVDTEYSFSNETK